MVFQYTFLLTAFFIASIVGQGQIIEVPPEVDEDNLYCWMYEAGIQNLNSTDCNRTCEEDGAPRICVYTFVLEHYHAMGSACGNCSQGVLRDCMHPQCIPGDGTERGLMSINRRRIGPPIQVCRDDILAINVNNRMGGTESTIHWHGILQEETQWMDGVPKITQCGIPEGSSFRYVFFANYAGTFFYHSHTGHHKTNGHNGALIIRGPISDEPSGDLYIEDSMDHVVLVSDYMGDYAETFFPGLPTRPPGIVPVSFLINGLGRRRDPATNQTTQTPLATFHISPGVSYRFRLINAASLVCPLQFQIENHTMTVIAADGTNVQPVQVDSIVSLSGERYDFVVNGTQNSGAFWIQLSGLFVCNAEDRINQVGVLSYGTQEDELGIYPTTPEPTLDNPLPYLTRLNHPDASCDLSDNEICVAELPGWLDDPIIEATDVLRINLTFGYYEWTVESLHGTADNPDTEYNVFQLRPVMRLESGIINGITNEFPDRVMMLDRDGGDFCNAQNRPQECSANGFCSCTHVIELPKDTVVELILQDLDDFQEPRIAHPFHLHGYEFFVMELARFNETLRMNGTQSANGIPPLKDTVVIPQGGSARLRLFTDNPGDWLFHCHFEWHMAIGMSLVFRVLGPVDPPPAESNFPTCGSYEPISSDTCPAGFSKSTPTSTPSLSDNEV